MTQNTKRLLQRVESWPTEDQEELASVAREIESRRTGVYALSDEERVAVRQGISAANEANFAPESEMEEFYKLHREA